MELDLITLLRAAWIAVTLPIIMASIPSSKLGSFRQLVSSFANRGKTMQTSSSKFTVPHRLFSHFYVGAVLWTTLLLLTTWLYAYRMAPLSSESFHVAYLASQLTGGSRSFSFHNSHMTSLEQRYRVWQIVLLLLLMEAQVIRRLFEAFYVSNYSPSARKHIFAYLTGLLVHREHMLNKWMTMKFIPTGDWFDIVSSPHYLAEIVIYAGLVVASGGEDLTVWLLFMFVVVSLGFAAATHNQYLRKFENYPRNRFAITPFIS